MVGFRWREKADSPRSRSRLAFVQISRLGLVARSERELLLLTSDSSPLANTSYLSHTLRVHCMLFAAPLPRIASAAARLSSTTASPALSASSSRSPAVVAAARLAHIRMVSEPFPSLLS